jgi:hypothetical protein
MVRRSVLRGGGLPRGEGRVALFDNHYYIKIRLNVDMETKRVHPKKVTKEPVR